MIYKQEFNHTIAKQIKTHFTRRLKVSVLFICFWILVLSIPVFSQNDEQDNGSIPSSTTAGSALVLQPGFGLRFNLNKKIRLYQDFRPYFNISNPTRNFGELSFGARYNLGHISKFYFSTLVGALLTLDNNYKIRIYRPKVFFTTSYHLNKFRIEFRNRLEYRIKIGVNSGSSLRYRPRFKVRFQYNVNQVQLLPYIYTELFVGQNGISQSRTKVALSVKYRNFYFTIGNLFKIKPKLGLVENRVSFNVSYTIPSFKKKK